MKYIKSITKEKRKLRLFCFPYAGGNSTTIYTPWRDEISDDIELFAVLLPARGELFLQDAIVDMDELVDKLYKEIVLYLDSDFAFFGHSMGGVIAFALLKRLELDGYRAKFIIISASKPPFEYTKSNDYMLSDKLLTDKLIAHNATPKEVLDNPGLMELILPIYRADLKLIHRYNPPPMPKLKSKLYLFNGVDDMPKEQIMQWCKYFESDVEYREFLGGHFFINDYRDLVLNEIVSVSNIAQDR
jgi:surfactin synthase thioesterase subunit